MSVRTRLTDTGYSAISLTPSKHDIPTDELQFP